LTNKLEHYTSVYSDYEIDNKLVSELFFDIDVDQVESVRRQINIDRDRVMIDHNIDLYNNFNLKTQREREALVDSSHRPDVVELIVQLEPIINVVRALYSGRRGVHLHVDLNPIRIADLRRAAIYVAELFGITDTVDKQTLGDWKRLCRVPYSYHGLSGQQCVVLNATTDTQLSHTLSELLHEKFAAKSSFNSYTVNAVNVDRRDDVYTLGEPPPCISYILGQLSAGIELTHQARLHLGAYLLKLGLKPDEAAVLFKTSPDFDYTVSYAHLRWMYEHNYKMYSCEKAKMYGLCPLPVDGCKYAPSINWSFW
jgi:hypothetical protein